jgi:putative ABC transport system permease protein
VVKHFLITYFRNVNNNKRHSVVNYLSLSLAIAVILLIFLFVNNELTYDKFHADSDRIDRLTTTLSTPGGEYHVAFANTAFAYKLRDELGEIENIACVSKSVSYQVKYGDQIFRENEVRFSTPEVLKLFSYKIINGNPGKILTEPNTAVLTETLSRKLFNKKDPIGEPVSFNDMVYTVVGIIKDLPDNTDLRFTALLASPINGSEDIMAWNDYFSYILVKDKNSPDLQNKIDKIAESTYKPLFTESNLKLSRTYKIQPLTKVHFDTSYLADTPKGNKRTSYTFMFIACLILIIACINYINLNLASAVTRCKEFTIRKIAGAGKTNIIVQLLGESIMNTFISLLLSIFIVLLFLPVFNKLADTNFNTQIFSSVSVILAALTIVLVIGIISGVYPAAYLFRFAKLTANPQNNLKTGFSRISKGLVTFQFVLSITMICVIIGVNKQIKHMQSYDLGFNKEQILSIDLNAIKNSSGNLNPLKQELSTNFMVATGGGGTQLGSSGEGSWRRPLYELKNEDGQDVQFILNMPEVDDNYLKLFGIEFVEGRNFSKERPADYDASIIINEAYAKIMRWDAPLNKKMFEDSKLRVIGVVSDFHFASLHNKIEPLAFRFNDKNPSYLFVKAPPAQIDYIKTVWRKYFKDVFFEYQFVDDNFEKQYQKDEKQKAIFGYLSFIAIFISCLGLFGLSSFFITRRIKEIGIRKVNGAKISEVLFMLNKDFVKWIVIAFVIAMPIAWYAMNKWLENFAYKTSLSWWIFALAGLMALGIALLTVSWQSWRAARRNPVEALRYE